MTDPRWFPETGNPGVSGYFFLKDILNPRKSKESGERVHEKRLFIRIRIAGQGDVFDGPATEKHLERFPEAYSYFKGEPVSAPTRGTPIENLDGMTDKVAARLRSYAIHTIEELADSPDGIVRSLGFGYTEYQKKARDVLGVRVEEKQSALEAENVALKDQMALLQQQMAELMDMVTLKQVAEAEEGGEGEEKPKRARHRKDSA